MLKWRTGLRSVGCRRPRAVDQRDRPPDSAWQGTRCARRCVRQPAGLSREAPGSIVDAVEPEIRRLLEAVPAHAGDGDRRAHRLGKTASRC